MADFKLAFGKTMANEGGYQNDPDDRGNLTGLGTYKGIAPKFWPKWRGWQVVKAIIGNMVNQPEFGTREYYNWLKAANRNLAGNPVLQRYVSEFYEVNFWNANRYGEIENQTIATWMFDRAVNCGNGAANKMLQRALDIPDDGIVGKQTLSATNKANADDLLDALKKEGKDYYENIVEKNPSQAKYLPGWLKRLEVA